jgi:hypothetical protein
MDVNDAGKHRRPHRPDGAPSIGGHEDFTKMALDPSQLEALVGDAGECVFDWSRARATRSAL